MAIGRADRQRLIGPGPGAQDQKGPVLRRFESGPVRTRHGARRSSNGNKANSDWLGRVNFGHGMGKANAQVNRC